MALYTKELHFFVLKKWVRETGFPMAARVTEQPRLPEL
jgi:hypothetical protein